jgi:hypothetical protein
MPVSRQFGRNLAISICGGVIVFVTITRHELPSLGFIYSYLYELQPETHGNLKEFGNNIHLPKLGKSVAERTDEINAELQAMPEIRLRSISIADRPCASGLIQCRGLGEGWVRRAALAERTDRAKKRDQETAQEAVQATKQSAEAAIKSAQAAKESADSALRSAIANEEAAAATKHGVLVAGYGGGISTCVFLLSLLEFLAKRRERQAAAATPVAPPPPAPAAPVTPAAPAGTAPTTNAAGTGVGNANPTAEDR